MSRPSIGIRHIVMRARSIIVFISALVLLTALFTDEIYLLGGHIAAATDRYPLADRLYQRIDPQDSHHPWRDYHRAAVHYAIGRDADAEQVWQMTAGDRNAPRALRAASAYNLGHIYYARQEYITAYRYFRDALRLQPGNRRIISAIEHAYRALPRDTSPSTAAATDNTPSPAPPERPTTRAHIPTSPATPRSNRDNRQKHYW